MRKWARPLIALVILSVSMLLLSAIFDNLSPYLVIPTSQEEGPPSRRANLTEDEKISPPSKVAVNPGYLIFVVSPADPVLYWRTSTADYYDGKGWYRTTRQITTHEFPDIQRSNATQVFTVEFNATEREILLPVPPPQTDLTQPVLNQPISYQYSIDEIGDTYGMEIPGLRDEAMIVYQAGWHYTEIDKWRVSLDTIPQEIRDLYLQLPSLPVEVKDLAETLKRSSVNPVDQILSDVAYFLIDFKYDLDYYMGRTRRTITRDWVLSYLQWRKGVCLDAATALAVILRCQGIPSRISLGYKPTRIDGDSVLYFSNTSHAETEAYLPPYGWVRFDATPPSPLDLPEDFGVLKPEKGLTLEISPTEAEGYPGESVLYHLMVNNSREMKDHFNLSMHNANGWDSEITPGSLSIGAYETRDVLIEIKIPENASYGQADTITVTATSTYNPEVQVSNTTIAKVGKIKREPTVTTIAYINNSVFRGDSFYIEGMVSTAAHEPVPDMRVLILFKETKEAKEGVVCGKGFSQQDGLFRIEGQVPFDVGLGDYAAVAVSLGTDKYASSDSDPSIMVMARTYLELDIRLEGSRVARPFLIQDTVLISGFLRLDNGTTISDAPLDLEIFVPESQTIRKHKLKTENGFFLRKFSFWAPGLYELNATFLGESYIAGSYSFREITVGSPLVHGLTEGFCVRGEALNVRGNVSSNKNGIPGEPVTVTFDGEVLATLETGLDGTFFYNWKIDSEVQLGWHLLSYTLQKRIGIGAAQSIRVMIKPQVTINVPEKVTGGDPFKCTISLRDDQGFPIHGAEISVGDYGVASKTDNHGNVEFMLDAPPLGWGNMSLPVTFRGSENYLPSITSVVVAVQPGIIPIVFALTTSALVILGLTTKRGKLGRVFHMEKPSEAELKKISAPLRPEASKTKLGTMKAMRIGFPDIRTPFPKVWGIRDNLRIECTLDGSPRTKQKGNEVELVVDHKTLGKDQLSRNQPAIFSHIFDEKGEHEVGARLISKPRRQSMEVETPVRIVDYREEIIRLYKAFLQHLGHQGVDWKDEMTAREVERLLLGTGGFEPKSLHRVMDCFERAEYSAHKVRRENYEAMYLSLKELIVNVD